MSEPKPELHDPALDLTIHDLVREAYENSKAKGFHDAYEGHPAPTFGDRIALMHSELSEALEEYRAKVPVGFVYWKDGGKPLTVDEAMKAARDVEREYDSVVSVIRSLYDSGYALVKKTITGEYTEGTNATVKPEGIPIELADVVIRIADACGKHGIDLDRAIKLKLAYNKTRPVRHGGKVI